MTSKLTDKKKAWVKTFKPTMLKGKPLHHNYAISARYEKRLRTLVQKMVKGTIKEIEALYKTPNSKDYFAMDASITSQSTILMNKLYKKFNAMFGESASLFAYDMVTSANKQSMATLSESLKQITGGLTVNTKIMSADLHETMKASIRQNVSYITSIPDEFLTKVEGAVMRSITSGQGMADLKPQLKSLGDISERKAKNLALDQTRKAYNSINIDRMKKVGVKKWEWIHSAGGMNPREDHIDLNGKTFTFTEPPIINKKTGQRGFPAEEPNCGCTLAPIIEFDDEE